MRKRAGVALCAIGAIGAAAAWLFQTPSFVILNGRFFEVWVLEAGLGLGLVGLGLVYLIHDARQG